MDDFSVDVIDGDTAHIRVKVHGELDVYTAPKLRQTLVELAARGPRRVALELSDVPFVDSTGLGVIIGGLRRLRATGGDLELLEVTDAVYRVFELCGLPAAFRSPPTRRRPSQ